ncbi:MAG: hypothetical protein AAB916_02410 [Patescibacteria group bacterium]
MCAFIDKKAPIRIGAIYYIPSFAFGAEQHAHILLVSLVRPARITTIGQAMLVTRAVSTSNAPSRKIKPSAVMKIGIMEWWGHRHVLPSCVIGIIEKGVLKIRDLYSACFTGL